MLRPGVRFPDITFQAYNPVEDSIEKYVLYDFLQKGKWVVLFWYPADFTFVCPTELADLAKHAQSFKDINVEVIAFSTDSPYVHKAWRQQEALLKDFNFLMGSDNGGRIARELGIFDEDAEVALRVTFVIDPKGTLRFVEGVTTEVGRSARELLRIIKALQYVDSHPGELCPASWEEGQETLKVG